MKIEHLQTNFTGGEISPTVLGRVDLAKFANCLATAENLQIRIQGGITQRDGLRYKATVNPGVRRIVPHIATLSDAYILAFYPNGFQVYKSGVLTATVTTPFSADEVDKFTYTQSNDVMVICVESQPPYQIKRASDSAWTCSPYPFTYAPQRENGYAPTGRTFTMSALSGSVTVTASVATFLAADVGRQITAGTGLAEITAIGGGGTTATVTTVTAFDVLFYDSTTVKVTLQDSPFTNVTISPSSTPVVGASITITTPIDCWRSSDVGSYVVMNSGSAKITGYTSATDVSATVVSAMTNADVAYPGGWSIKTPFWKAGNYPSCVVFHEGRLILAGSPSFPQTLWLSTVSGFADFTEGTDPDDAMMRELNADRRDQIRHLVSSRTLLAFSYNTEYSIAGSGNTSITPLTITAKAQSTYGSDKCLPEVIGGEVVFVQRAGSRIRGTAYAFEADQYVASDITELHDRITSAGVKEIIYAQEPYQTVWAVLNDGTACSFTYSKQQAVTGFVRHSFPGDVVSMASVPVTSRDDTYAVIDRNGVKMLCVFEDGLCLDLAGTASGSGITSGTFAWLANETVKPIFDDCPDVELTADGSGLVTFPYAVDSATVGLSFTPKAVLLPMEFQLNGTTQGRMVGISEVMLRLLETQGLYVNGNPQSFRTTADTPTLNRPSPAFTGDHVIQVLGSQRNGKPVTIEQRQPLPFHILCIRRTATVSE
jgi:hypothetical protein